MTAKEFDPVAFYNAKRDEFLGKGVMSRVSNDSTAADVLRDLAAEAAKQQARRDADICKEQPFKHGLQKADRRSRMAELCAQAIEKESGL